MKKKKYNTSKIKTFLLFLFVACVIWVLTKFSKEYTATIDGNLSYINLPENSVLGENNPDKISFDITANGFEFMQYQIKTPEIEVDVGGYYSEENNSALIGKNELSRIISVQLDKEVAVKNVSIQELKVYLDVVVSKRIPVVVDAQIEYKEGFRAVDEINIEPDSVDVSGPQNLLDKITEITTLPITLNDVDTSEELTGKFDLKKYPKLKFNPTEVQVSIEVVEFTQKKISVPIDMLNLPPNTTIKLIPESINLTFEVSLADFNSVTANDFSVVCDFMEKDSEGNFLTAKLIKEPENIFNIEFSERKIDYLIFK